MRSRYLLLFIASFAFAIPGHKKCGRMTDPALPQGVEPSSIGIQVCEAHQATAFAFFTKPIRVIINKWLGRHYIDDRERNELLNDLPWSITNIPSYANYTIPDPDKEERGSWNVQIRGYLYKRRTMTTKQVDNLVNRILIRASIKKEKFYRGWFYSLNATESEQSRRQVKEIATASIQNGAIEVRFSALGDKSGMVLRTLTNEEGGFEQTVSLSTTCNQRINDSDSRGTAWDLSSGVRSTNVTLVSLNVPGGRHNESRNTRRTFFVPPRGLSIVSDVDNVLRIAEIWNWKQAVLGLFSRKYEPWLGMEHVYKNWSQDIRGGGGGRWRNGTWVESERSGTTDEVTNVHFHYITDTPEINAAFYIDGTLEHFPAGSFDFRPMDFTDSKKSLDGRYISTKRLLETFPQRKFILVVDTTHESSMRKIPQLAMDYPDQVQCILVRDVEATEPADYIVPATRHFLKLPRNKYLFFRTPAGSMTPTLANLSTTHLASLAALNSSSRDSAGFPYYDQSLGEGCFPIWDMVPQSRVLDKAKGTRLKTILKLAWYKTQCLFIQRWRRPNRACPFDRRPGTVYWNKQTEPNHDS